MKREIFCQPCALKLGAINPFRQVSELDAAMAAQEKVVKVYGLLKGNASCDFCGKQMAKGDMAACQSIALSEKQYYPWESDFIETQGKIT